jgi:hypothetical protein
MPQTSKKRKNGHPRSIFSQVFICSNQELAPFGTAFLFSPENYEQQKLGTLFGVIKVDDHSSDSSYIVNLLTSVIKKEFFSKPERTAEESFEASLRKANLALAELARHGSLNWSGKINFAAGVMEKSTLHFSSLGNAYVFLIRSGQIAEISRELEEEKEAEPHPLKTFSNISSGKMEKDDKLIFTTDDLLDIFSKEELRHNALHFSAKEFPGLIELALQANSQLAGAIIVDMSDEPEIAIEPKRASGIKSDIDLTPTPRIEKAPLTPKPSLDISEERKNHIYIKSEEEDLPPKQPLSERVIVFSRKIPIILRNIFSKIHEKFSNTKQNLAGKGKISPYKIEKISNRIRKIFYVIGSGMKHISGSLPELIQQRKKGFGIAFLSILAILLIFFTYRWISPTKTTQKAELPENIPVEASLPQIPDDIQINKIDGIQEIVSFSEKVIRIAILDGVLYAIPENSKTVLKINPGSKNVEEIKSNIGEGNFKLIAAMPQLKTLFMLDSDNRIISLTPVNKNFQENNIAFPDNLKASDMKTYLTYLYILDPAASQIYRFPRAEGGFGEKQDWLKTGSDIKQAKSFSINEDLFTASENEISAFLQGKKDPGVEFEKPKIALVINRIFSEPDMENIYVLDNKNHRVIKYSKTGKIIAQYWNESIANIQDLLANEKDKTIYLLSDKKISSFTME